MHRDLERLFTSNSAYSIDSYKCFWYDNLDYDNDKQKYREEDFKKDEF